jgi:hypothetical protein
VPSYDTINLSKNGDIYLHGPIPFRFISFVSCNNILLNTLTLHLCESC